MTEPIQHATVPCHLKYQLYKTAPLFWVLEVTDMPLAHRIRFGIEFVGNIVATGDHTILLYW